MPELSPFAEVAQRPVTAAAIGLVGTWARPPLMGSFIVVRLVGGGGIAPCHASKARCG